MRAGATAATLPAPRSLSAETPHTRGRQRPLGPNHPLELWGSRGKGGGAGRAASRRRVRCQPDASPWGLTAPCPHPPQGRSQPLPGLTATSAFLHKALMTGESWPPCQRAGPFATRTLRHHVGLMALRLREVSEEAVTRGSGGAACYKRAALSVVRQEPGGADDPAAPRPPAPPQHSPAGQHPACPNLALGSRTRGPAQEASLGAGIRGTDQPAPDVLLTSGKPPTFSELPTEGVGANSFFKLSWVEVECVSMYDKSI